jgi:hypothetical protein
MVGSVLPSNGKKNLPIFCGYDDKYGKACGDTISNF